MKSWVYVVEKHAKLQFMPSGYFMGRSGSYFDGFKVWFPLVHPKERKHVIGYSCAMFSQGYGKVAFEIRGCWRKFERTIRRKLPADLDVCPSQSLYHSFLERFLCVPARMYSSSELSATLRIFCKST